jgi:hypothetical protein
MLGDCRTRSTGVLVVVDLFALGFRASLFIGIAISLVPRRRAAAARRPTVNIVVVLLILAVGAGRRRHHVGVRRATCLAQGSRRGSLFAGGEAHGR